MQEVKEERRGFVKSRWINEKEEAKASEILDGWAQQGFSYEDAATIIKAIEIELKRRQKRLLQVTVPTPLQEGS